METVWFGAKLAFGLVLGFGAIFLVYREVRGFLYTHKFVRAGCTWQKGEKPGTPSGWFTRDIQLDDYILWDDAHNICWRMADPMSYFKWSEKQHKAWADSRQISQTTWEIVVQDSGQWNVSNYSLKQFLVLAREYSNFWKGQTSSK